MLAEEAAKVMLLFDFYGGLLPAKQQEIITLYYGENLSLAEIGEDLNISRQGVHDALKKAAASLREYDGKLRLLGKFQAAELALNTIVNEIDKLSAYIDDIEDLNSKDMEDTESLTGAGLLIDKKRLAGMVSTIRSAIQQIEI